MLNSKTKTYVLSGSCVKVYFGEANSIDNTWIDLYYDSTHGHRFICATNGIFYYKINGSTFTEVWGMLKQ